MLKWRFNIDLILDDFRIGKIDIFEAQAKIEEKCKQEIKQAVEPIDELSGNPAKWKSEILKSRGIE